MTACSRFCQMQDTLQESRPCVKPLALRVPEGWQIHVCTAWMHCSFELLLGHGLWETPRHRLIDLQTVRLQTVQNAY